MEVTQIVAIKSKLSNEIEVGDYVTLSKVLNIKPQASRARYKRSNVQAVVFMEQIVNSKKKLIVKLKSKIQ